MVMAMQTFREATAVLPMRFMLRLMQRLMQRFMQRLMQRLMQKLMQRLMQRFIQAAFTLGGCGRMASSSFSSRAPSRRVHRDGVHRECAIALPTFARVPRQGQIRMAI